MPQEEQITWLETKYGDRIILTGICSIGRAETNNVIISKGSVSRHHAIVHERDKEYWVVDLGGVNGILLNGKRVIQAAPLKSGDLIQIPTTDFTFYQEAAPAQAPAPVESKTPESKPVESKAPESKASSPKETSPEKDPAPAVTPKPEPSPAPKEISTPTASTIPLPEPVPVKPTQLKADSPKQSVTPKPEPSPVPKEVSIPAAIAIPLPDPVPVKPTQPEADSPKEPVTPKPEPSPVPKEVSTPAAIAIPLPEPVLLKPTQQDELSLGLPPNLINQTTSLKKPRVYVAPVDTQGLPKPLLTKTARPEALKLPGTPSGLSATLPKFSDDPLKVTTPLFPPAPLEKPKEMMRINAPDVVVPEAVKPKASPDTPPPIPKVETAAKADTFLQPSTSQEAASSTKPPELPQKPKVAVSTSLPAAPAPQVTKAPPPTPTIAPLVAPKTETAAKPDTFLQPSISQETASSPKPVELPKKPKEAVSISLTAAPAPQVAKAPPSLPKVAPQLAAISESAGPDIDDFLIAPPSTKAPAPTPTLQRPAISAKVDKSKISTPIQPISQEPGKLTRAINKVATPVPKEVPVTPKIVPAAVPTAVPPAAVVPLQESGLYPSSRHSLYISLASTFLPFVGVVTALIAIVLAHSALKKIKQTKGTLAGHQSEVLVPYFGYLSLGVVSSYSILIFFFFFSSSHSTDLAHSVNPPPVLAVTPAAIAPSPAATETPAKPEPAPVTPAPVASTDTPTPHATPDLQVTPPPQSSPTVSDASSRPSLDTAPPARIPVPPPDAAPAPQVAISESPAPASPPPPKPAPVADTGTAPSAADVAPVSPPGVLAVYDPVALNRLKDGMLLQPMPEDTLSRDYKDAESFNNCALILARPPESKYADSVGEFLDDVKNRNPDPTRLKILTIMYSRYIDGLKKVY